MDNNTMLQATLSTFSIWNETMDILDAMEISIGGEVGANLGQYLPISLMDTVIACLNGKIEDREEKDPETGEIISTRYYKLESGTEYRLDDAIRFVIESISSSENAEECADKIKTIFV